MLHKDHMHCGSNTLIAITRQKFWPIKIKTMARAVLHKCVQCVKAKPVLYKQLMGNLSRPFSNTGVDFCELFHVHYEVRGNKPHKVYIAVFCCFATKASHLEVGTDLTTSWSCDLRTLDYFLWGYVKAHVNTYKPASIDALKYNIERYY